MEKGYKILGDFETELEKIIEKLERSIKEDESINQLTISVRKLIHGTGFDVEDFLMQSPDSLAEIIKKTTLANEYSKEKLEYLFNILNNDILKRSKSTRYAMALEDVKNVGVVFNNISRTASKNFVIKEQKAYLERLTDLYSKITNGTVSSTVNLDEVVELLNDSYIRKYTDEEKKELVTTIIKANVFYLLESERHIREELRLKELMEKAKTETIEVSGAISSERVEELLEDVEVNDEDTEYVHSTLSDEDMSLFLKIKEIVDSEYSQIKGIGSLSYITLIYKSYIEGNMTIDQITEALTSKEHYRVFILLKLRDLSKKIEDYLEDKVDKELAIEHLQDTNKFFQELKTVYENEYSLPEEKKESDNGVVTELMPIIFTNGARDFIESLRKTPGKKNFVFKLIESVRLGHTSSDNFLILNNRNTPYAFHGSDYYLIYRRLPSDIIIIHSIIPRNDLSKLNDARVVNDGNRIDINNPEVLKKLAADSEEILDELKRRIYGK